MRRRKTALTALAILAFFAAGRLPAADSLTVQQAAVVRAPSTGGQWSVIAADLSRPTVATLDGGAAVILTVPGRYVVIWSGAGKLLTADAVVGSPGPGPTPPGPGPGPTPEPPIPTPPPDPPAPPTPQKISAALIEDATARPSLSKAQIETLTSKQAAAHMNGRGYVWRVLDRDAQDVNGKPPADCEWFQRQAAGQTLPLVVIGASGSSKPLYVGPSPLSPSLLVDLLTRYGGPSTGLAWRPLAVDLSRAPVDPADPPEGRVTGCLPRSKAKALFPGRDFAAAFAPIPRAQWQDRLLSVRQHVWHVYDQGSLSSCASNATVQSLLVLRSVANLPEVVLSPGSVYGPIAYPRDSGSTLDDNLEQISAVGAVPAALVKPNDWNPGKFPAGWQTAAKPYRVVEWFDLGGKFDNVASAVLYGFPAVIGVSWSGGGGHSVCVVGLAKSSSGVWSLVYVNSWSADWGDSGFGLLTESACRSMPNYGAWSPIVPIYDGKPTADVSPAPKPQPKAKPIIPPAAVVPSAPKAPAASVAEPQTDRDSTRRPAPFFRPIEAEAAGVAALAG